MKKSTKRKSLAIVNAVASRNDKQGKGAGKTALPFKFYHILNKMRTKITILLVLLIFIRVIFKIPDMNVQDWITLLQGIIIGMAITFLLVWKVFKND